MVEIYYLHIRHEVLALAMEEGKGGGISAHGICRPRSLLREELNGVCLYLVLY